MTRTIAVVLIFLGVALAGAFIFGGPIASYWKHRTADAEAGQERATDDATGRGLEVQGTQELGAAASDLQSSAAAMRRAANALDEQARQDPAASDVLPPSVLDRIRVGDDGLCGRAVQCPDRGKPSAPGRPAMGAATLHRDDEPSPDSQRP